MASHTFIGSHLESRKAIIAPWVYMPQGRSCGAPKHITTTDLIDGNRRFIFTCCCLSDVFVGDDDTRPLGFVVRLIQIGEEGCVIHELHWKTFSNLANYILLRPLCIHSSNRTSIHTFIYCTASHSLHFYLLFRISLLLETHSGHWLVYFTCLNAGLAEWDLCFEQKSIQTHF